MHSGAAPQTATALRVLGLHQMPPPRALAQDFSTGRNLKTFGRRFLGLYAFWTSHSESAFSQKRARNIGGRLELSKRYFRICASRESVYVIGTGKRKSCRPGQLIRKFLGPVPPSRLIQKCGHNFQKTIGLLDVNQVARPGYGFESGCGE